MMTPTVTETRQWKPSRGAREAREKTRPPSASACCMASESTASCVFSRGEVALVSARARAEDDRCRFVAGVWREEVGEKRQNDRRALVGRVATDWGCGHECDFVKAAGRGRRVCGAGEVFGEAWRSSPVWPAGGRGLRVTDVPLAAGGRAYLVERGRRRRAPMRTRYCRR